MKAVTPEEANRAVVKLRAALSARAILPPLPPVTTGRPSPASSESLPSSRREPSSFPAVERVVDWQPATRQPTEAPSEISVSVTLEEDSVTAVVPTAEESAPRTSNATTQQVSPTENVVVAPPASPEVRTKERPPTLGDIPGIWASRIRRALFLLAVAIVGVVVADRYGYLPEPVREWVVAKAVATTGVDRSVFDWKRPSTR